MGAGTSRPIEQEHPLSILAELAGRLIAIAGALLILDSLLFFPRASDHPLTEQERAEARRFYTSAYQQQNPAEKEDTRYVRIAEAAAEIYHVKSEAEEIAQKYGLKGKKVLDVGAGRGYLQDVVPDYTGLDISPSARRFFHKPFALASATLMPFPDNQFDSVWSVWVLEHVPNPEAALVEIRRVAKDGGLLYLRPAWDASPFAANGYDVRPYSDFGMQGKFVKAFIPVYQGCWLFSKPLIGAARFGAWKLTGAPTTLRYRRLAPNYDFYWQPDSDAVNSLDRYEMALWFLSRGDECLNCEGAMDGWMRRLGDPLLIRVHKQ